MKKEWIKTSEELPYHLGDVWIAGEMKYLRKPEYGIKEDEIEYFVGIGWLTDENEYRMNRSCHPDIPDDVDRWHTLNDWYEGQEYFKITHWMEIDEPEHPISINN